MAASERALRQIGGDLYTVTVKVPVVKKDSRSGKVRTEWRDKVLCENAEYWIALKVINEAERSGMYQYSPRAATATVGETRRLLTTVLRGGDVTVEPEPGRSASLYRAAEVLYG